MTLSWWECKPALQSQEAITAYFTSKELLSFSFVEHNGKPVVLSESTWHTGRDNAHITIHCSEKSKDSDCLV